VPIVAVFTKFDKLVSRMEENLTDDEMDMSNEDINSLCLQRADDEFKKLCVAPLEKINQTLPYAKISGLIPRIPSAFVILSDIYVILSSGSTIPIDFKGTYRSYSRSRREICGRECLDRFCNGSESQRSSQNQFLH